MKKKFKLLNGGSQLASDNTRTIEGQKQQHTFLSEKQ